jgi:peptidyl-prolyl cis-trans isomerase-like 3
LLLLVKVPKGSHLVRIRVHVTDLKYTVFGRVLDGWDTLDQLERLQTNPKNHKPMPGKEARVTSVTIHANPLAG